MTSSSQSLLDLAARVEAAEGASRELGEEVLLACGWTKTRVGYFLGPLYHWRSLDGARHFDADHFDRGKWNPTQYVDSAMTLLPKGYEYSLGSGRRKAGNPEHVSPWARVFPEADAAVCFLSLAADPALALTAAALRARAQEQSA